MTTHRIALLAATLLLGATPLAQAGSRHVEVSVNLGTYLPVHLGYAERAPLVIYPPVPVRHYRPVVYGHPGHYYHRGYHGYGKGHHQVHHRNRHGYGRHGNDERHDAHQGGRGHDRD